MSLFDSILKSTGGAPDDVVNLADKLGIDPVMAEKAIAALSQAHTKPGDTVDLAAAKTGMDNGILSQIVQQIGEEWYLPVWSVGPDQVREATPRRHHVLQRAVGGAADHGRSI